MPGQCRTSRLHHSKIENILDAGERGQGVYIQVASQTRGVVGANHRTQSSWCLYLIGTVATVHCMLHNVTYIHIPSWANR